MIIKNMIYKTKPEQFTPKFEIVSCFVENNGKILLLHRQDHKPQGNTWGVPAGKVDPHENITEAMIREMTEEIGYQANIDELKYFDKVFVKYDTYDFIYHMFHLPLLVQKEIVINPKEHKTYSWQTPEEALQMNLIQDEDFCIKLFYRI